MTCDTVWRGFTAPQTRAETPGTLNMADRDVRSGSDGSRDPTSATVDVSLTRP